MNTSTSASSFSHGWHSAPNERGTIDIIWSCVSTVFLCLWSMLHLNVPAPSDGFWTIFWRKARWLLLGVLAPEVPMLMACGQWSSAKRSVQQMRDLGFNDDQWTMSHAFFADSGGIVLQLQDDEPFPISAKQLAWLLRQRHAALPAMTERDIKDKSKGDKCTKALAVLQTAWFMIQMIGRGAEHLPITPIELASAALALTSLTTLWFWLDKPLDVQQPYLLRLDHLPPTAFHDSKTAEVRVEEVKFEEEASSSQATFVLPLDEIEPRAYISRKWSRTFLNLIFHLSLQRPRMDRIPNDRDPQILGFYQHLTLGVATAAFASIHFVDWHFAFATKAELIIWRINCCIMWSLLAVYGSAEVFMCWREGYKKLGMDTAGGYKLRWPACLWFFIPAGTYSIARLVLTVGVFVNLRSLPKDAFVQVQWTTVLPHI